jgi:hypothetical protein
MPSSTRWRPACPDADTQAIFLSLVDRFTPSHLPLLTPWDDPPAWFASHGLTPPEAGMAGSRTQTMEAGLAEMKGRKDFYLLIASELAQQCACRKSRPWIWPAELLFLPSGRDDHRPCACGSCSSWPHG